MDREQPQHTVELSPFRLARWPVTVAQFRAFAAAAGFDVENKRALAGREGDDHGYGQHGRTAVRPYVGLCLAVMTMATANTDPAPKRRVVLPCLDADARRYSARRCPGENSKSIHSRHDRTYRLLFSYPEMVKDALTGFIHEPWVGELDFSTLEKMAEIHVSDRLDLRFQDVVWKVRCRDTDIYLCLLVEFPRRGTSEIWPE